MKILKGVDVKMHIEKYNKNQIGHIFSHINNTYARKNRDNVDCSLTSKNYNLLNTNKSANELLKDVLQNVNYSKRKDLVLAVSVIITEPDNLPKNMRKQFFYYSSKFVLDYFNQNESNCLAAIVHEDEPNARAHEHLLFVPLVRDKKDIGNYKICCKEVITKKALQNFHKEYKQFIDDKFPNLDLNVINGKTAGANKTITELKTESLKKQIEEQENDIKKLKQLKNKLRMRLNMN